MTALQIVRRTRVTLALVVVTTAVLTGFAAGGGVIVLAGLLQLVVALPSLVPALLVPVATAAGLTGCAIVLWRNRTVVSVQHVALWLEERLPELRYALVTAIDPAIAPADRYPALHARVRASDTSSAVRTAWRRPITRSLTAALTVAALLAVLQPQELLGTGGTDLLRRVGNGENEVLANRLEGVIARVSPPAYARMDDSTVEDPVTVAALVGSRVTFQGRGPSSGVTAIVDSTSTEAGEAGRGWTIALQMDTAPAVVTLRDREYRRLVVLETVVDSVPAVRLRLPARDTTYQTVPRGRMTVEAEITDDIGLAHGWFEYMVSTGSAEVFETRTSQGRRIGLDNARTGTLREVIDLDTMRLAPGTVFHIRAVALDHNDVTGPGKGVSDTRTLRIAEPEDSTSINPTPPLPIDSMWMSQRRLNMMTDTLIRMAPQLDRQELTHRSSAYGNAQDEIRQRALAVISILEDDAVGGTFQTQTSTKLREAADLMYEARVNLAITMPDSAMPHMIRVLEILDEIRLANRYYLRGIIQPAAVNVARVRLTGEDPATEEPRRPRAELADERAALAERIAHAASIAREQPDAAVDSLVYIRVAALRLAPDVADALASAAALLRRGESVDTALDRARRALEPPPARIRGPVEWSGIGN